mmetsp:Transcript_22452/g.76268  ORF Transcript_22452/g.76268 Transcript_22452/m.76268 type:complete len:352 (-) Transcript_22452:613-1668(-)
MSVLITSLTMSFRRRVRCSHPSPSRKSSPGESSSSHPRHALTFSITASLLYSLATCARVSTRKLLFTPWWPRSWMEAAMTSARACSGSNCGCARHTIASRVCTTSAACVPQWYALLSSWSRSAARRKRASFVRSRPNSASRPSLANAARPHATSGCPRDALPKAKASKVSGAGAGPAATPEMERSSVRRASSVPVPAQMTSGGRDGMRSSESADLAGVDESTLSSESHPEVTIVTSTPDSEDNDERLPFSRSASRIAALRLLRRSRHTANASAPAPAPRSAPAPTATRSSTESSLPPPEPPSSTCGASQKMLELVTVTFANSPSLMKAPLSEKHLRWFSSVPAAHLPRAGL